jgi:hypothetical protein
MILFMLLYVTCLYISILLYGEPTVPLRTASPFKVEVLRTSDPYAPSLGNAHPKGGHNNSIVLRLKLREREGAYGSDPRMGSTLCGEAALRGTVGSP